MENRLSRRERQIMDIVYARGAVTAVEIQDAMADGSGNSAVRTFLRILETKGHLRHEKEGARYVYRPTQPRQNAARSALSQVVQTFFGGSVEQAVTTLLSDSETSLTEEEFGRLALLLEKAKAEEKEPEV